MAQMIPTEIFYGKEYDTESGAEMALFKILNCQTKCNTLS